VLELLDTTRKRIAILQDVQKEAYNAYQMVETLTLNSINLFDFTLAYNDPNNAKIEPFMFVRYNNGALYQIMPNTLNFNEQGDINYHCEHVFGMLMEHTLPGGHKIGNLGTYTRDVIAWLLDKQNKTYDVFNDLWTVDSQKTINWVLGECDFNRQYEYNWEEEQILSALFTIPQPFTDKYMWTFDTTVYPFVLNLKMIDETKLPEMYIRAEKNMLNVELSTDPSKVYTRIYAYGAGEGINKVMLNSVNNGKPYIQSDPAIIAKYGIRERTWTDRRYTSPQALLDAANAMLMAYETPLEEISVEYQQVGNTNFDIAQLGKIVQIVDYKKTFITAISYHYDEIQSSTITLANKPNDIASSVSSMQDRQRIESTYAQGSTIFYEKDWYDNCDSNIPLVLKFSVPDLQEFNNMVRLHIELNPFRKPFKVTGGGGATTITQQGTTSSGSSSSTTTSSSGGTSDTTGSGGSQEITSVNTPLDLTVSKAYGEAGGLQNTGSGGIHNHDIESDERYVYELSLSKNDDGAVDGISMYRDYVEGSTTSDGSHYHAIDVDGGRFLSDLTLSIRQHSHKINLPSHTHNFTDPSHSHIMSHTHNITHTHTVDKHDHTLIPGMEYSGNPTSFRLVINGIERTIVVDRTWTGDIYQWLYNDIGELPRNVYHTIEVYPNSPAYVMTTISVMGFVKPTIPVKI
jgi:phage minor structural protein